MCVTCVTDSLLHARALVMETISALPASLAILESTVNGEAVVLSVMEKIQCFNISNIVSMKAGGFVPKKSLA